MKRFLIFLSLAVAAVAVAVAQAPKPISWRMTARMTSETEGVVTIKAVCEEGWHLYGTRLPESAGPKPTSIEMSSPKSLKWEGALVPDKAPVEKDDPVFGVKLNWWEDGVTFTRRFTTSNTENPGTVTVKVTFMGCNDETCLPPSTETLTRTIKPFKK